jgi:hypothetical protein
VVVDESNDGAGHQPAPLNSCQQEGIGFNELALGCEFLDECCDGRPEHPEARGDQHVHQVELSDLDSVPERENRDCHDDDGAGGVENHDEAATVLAVDDDSGEGEHQHRRQRLQDREGAQSQLRMSCLEDVPGDGSRIHPATQHRNDIGQQNEPKRPFLQNGAHLFTVMERRLAPISSRVRARFRTDHCASFVIVSLV